MGIYLGQSSGTAGVEDVERVLALDGDTVLDLLAREADPLELVVPVEVATGRVQGDAACVSLENDPVCGLVCAHVDGLVQHFYKNKREKKKLSYLLSK